MSSIVEFQRDERRRHRGSRPWASTIESSSSASRSQLFAFTAFVAFLSALRRSTCVSAECNLSMTIRFASALASASSFAVWVTRADGPFASSSPLSFACFVEGRYWIWFENMKISVRRVCIARESGRNVSLFFATLTGMYRDGDGGGGGWECVSHFSIFKSKRPEKENKQTNKQTYGKRDCEDDQFRAAKLLINCWTRKAL